MKAVLLRRLLLGRDSARIKIRLFALRKCIFSLLLQILAIDLTENEKNTASSRSIRAISTNGDTMSAVHQAPRGP